MCKSYYEKLLVFQPLNEHTIISYGYDEEEELWKNEPVNLEVYLKKMIHTNKIIKEYFENIN